MEDTLRAPLSAMALLAYHLVLSHLIDSRLPDLELCSRLLKPLTQRYPNVGFFGLLTMDFGKMIRSYELIMHYGLQIP